MKHQPMNILNLTNRMGFIGNPLCVIYLFVILTIFLITMESVPSGLFINSILSLLPA